MTKETLEKMCLAKVRSVDSSQNWSWMYINSDQVHYIHVIDGNGDFHGHFMVGMALREFIVHSADIKLLFEI